MNLIVNGTEVSVAEPGPLPISRLLEKLHVSDPEYVTVELNGDIQTRGDFDRVAVREGDRVEFLYYMGGGR